MLTCLYDVIGYALLGSMCLCVYFHALWLDPCLHMLVCSNSCSFHIYVLGLYMSMCMFPCLLVLIYMFSHAYVLGFVFSTCFMPSSRCLHASHFVYALRPRPCLSCHVLLQPFSSFCHIFLCFVLMVRTRSRPCSFCHHPYTKVHIKGFGSPYLHVYVSLSSSKLCHA